MNVYPVNKSDFRLIRGVRNEVLFQARDIDRKPVVLPAGDSLIITIIDPLSKTVLMTRELIPADTTKGVYQLVLWPAELDMWLSGPLSWSIIRSNVAGSGMLWTDLNYTPSATLIVTEGPLPGPATTVMADWSSFTLLDNWYYGTSMIGATQDGYLNGMHTFRVLMTAFVGTIRVETTRVVQPTPLDWELTNQQDYAGSIDVDVLNVQGNFYWLRLAVNLVTGALDQVQYKA